MSKAFTLGIALTIMWLLCPCDSDLPAADTLRQDEQVFEPAPVLPFSATDRMAGLNFVSPPREWTESPMPAVKAVAADWIAVIPFGFTRPGSASVRYHGNDGRWWGETPNGARSIIQQAHQAGIHVMLKPQVYVPGSWTGKLDFDSDSEWEAWEKDYTAYIQVFLDIAIEEKVELFCVGTEFKIGAVKRPDFWKKLIQDVRKQYAGKLTYAANWDEYPHVPFWEDLDYIGVDAYFPLVNSPTPTVKDLKSAWKKPVARMKALADSTHKPILFSEYGYLSVDRCAYNSWELEGIIDDVAVNEQAQANAIQALWETLGQEPWWKGGFLWKWFPNMEGHEGYPHKDYTPQGKVAESVLRKSHESYCK